MAHMAVRAGEANSTAGITSISISFKYNLSTQLPQLLLELGDGDSFGFGVGAADHYLE